MNHGVRAGLGAGLVVGQEVEHEANCRYHLTFEVGRDLIGEGSFDGTLAAADNADRSFDGGIMRVGRRGGMDDTAGGKGGCACDVMGGLVSDDPEDAESVSVHGGNEEVKGSDGCANNECCDGGHEDIS
jgi:hypothetical protein